MSTTRIVLALATFLILKFTTKLKSVIRLLYWTGNDKILIWLLKLVIDIISLQ